MINFSDAQMLGANDKAFQNQYNYLVELVSTYLTRGMLQSVNENTYIDLGKNRFQFMKDANNYIKWDGETFEVKGKITVTSGTATRTFVAEPTTPYKIGDIWMQGGTGNILVCTTSRETGAYNSDDWEVSSKYTDDTLAATKTKTFYQSSVPTSTAIGDLWVDTDDDNVIYRAESVGADEIADGEWVKMPFGVGALGDTVIDGGYIKTTLLTADNIITGKLQDSNGSTYFDLDNAEIVATDGTNKLVLDETGLHGYVSDVLRVEVEYDRLEFHRAGNSVGNIRTVNLGQSWHGLTIGDALFVEAAGQYIAFNALSGATAPSMLVGPTWVEIPALYSETINVGTSDPAPWSIETSGTSDANFVIKGVYGDHLSINDYTGQITIGGDVDINGAIIGSKRKVIYLTTGDCNTITEEWVVTHPDVLNTPLQGTTYWYIQTILMNTGNNRQQIAYRYNGFDMYRRRYDGGWSGWTKTWTGSTDGSGSGLDADLLDGYHASSFPRIIATTTYNYAISNLAPNDYTSFTLSVSGVADYDQVLVAVPGIVSGDFVIRGNASSDSVTVVITNVSNSTKSTNSFTYKIMVLR